MVARGGNVVDLRRSPGGLPGRPAFAFLLLGLLALLLNLPYLTGGLGADDLALLDRIAAEPPAFSRWFGLWSVDLATGAAAPWWLDDDAQGSFWRPLSSLVLEGAVGLLGGHAFPLHVLTIVLHGLVGGTVYLVVRRMSGDATMALLAGVLFVTCEDHSLGIGWVATIGNLLCVALVGGALVAHLVWLQQRRAWAWLLSMVALAAAFACKETAATAPLLIVWTTYLLPRGRDDRPVSYTGRGAGERLVGLLRDPLSWAPQLALLVLYLALYEGIPLGGTRSLAYIDPFSQPGRYVVHASLHLPVMWLATLSPVPPSLGSVTPGALLPSAIAGLLLFSGLLVVLSPLRSRPVAVWGMGVYLLALAPQLGTDASQRGLYLPTVGAAAMLALLLMEVGPLLRRPIPPPRRVDKLPRIGGWCVLVGVLLPGLLLSGIYPLVHVPRLRKPERSAATAIETIRATDPDHVVVLNTSGPLETYHVGPMIQHLLGEPLDVRVLSSCNGVMTIRRQPGDTFILENDRRGWLSNLQARRARTRPRLSPHRRYPGDLFVAELVELTRYRRDALAVRFELERPLDDPSLLFLYWSGDAYRPLAIDALVPGEGRVLADTSDVWESMQ